MSSLLFVKLILAIGLHSLHILRYNSLYHKVMEMSINVQSKNPLTAEKALMLYFGKLPVD